MRYDLILADPAWKYAFCRTPDKRGIDQNHYRTMSLERICALHVPEVTASRCVLFLWGTAPKLPEALGVMAAWGFEYKTQLVWVKTSKGGCECLGPRQGRKTPAYRVELATGNGHYSRVAHEIVLIGQKRGGALPLLPDGDRPLLHSVFFHERMGHSCKPPTAHEYAEAMFPHAQHRLEMFARTRRPGWDAWGLEVPGGNDVELEW